ncbi:unnamed protein product [Gordionus sp. m RMFG-2023]
MSVVSDSILNKKLDFDIKLLPDEIYNSYQKLLNRCLYKNSQWFAELLFSIDDSTTPNIEHKEQALSNKNYILAKGYFDVKEYERASYYARDKDDTLISFIYFYSKYQALNFKSNPSFQFSHVIYEDDLNGYKNDYNSLYKELNDLYLNNKADGLGIILVKMNCRDEALKIFIESINLEPHIWGSWLEMVDLIPTFEQITTMQLPKHWITYFFVSRYLVRDNKWEMALNIYQLLEDSGFKKCIYIRNQVANIHFQMKDMEQSLKSFQNLQITDPYCLDNIDIYSNVLYVLEKDEELSILAQHCQDIDPFRPEACCVIGNYFSLKGDRYKAIIYFQRAITLNADFYSAWVLIGHEYNELKNTSAAIYAYHKASKINPYDYRVWNGFGLTYEIMMMPSYSLYYYKRAHMLNPTDSRLLMALGECFEALGKMKQAKLYYQRALIGGDLEETATFKLAKACEALQDTRNAALAYNKYLQDAKNRKVSNTAEEAHALKYLGYYYYSAKDYLKAYSCFHKCFSYVEALEDGKIMVNKLQDYVKSVIPIL